jgi:hypothetical protein
MAGWRMSLRWVSLREDLLTRRHPQPFNQPMPATNRPSREPIITRPATTAPCHSAAISRVTNRVCRDIRNASDIPQTTAPTGRPAPSRMSGHTLRNRYPADRSHRQTSLQITHAQTYATAATARGSGTSTCTDTGTTASPDKRHAIDHLDRGIRRVTARVWRAAAPRRPRSSSTRAG